LSKHKLAIFDLAGTTVRDSNTVGGCLQGALGAAGLQVSVADVNSVMGIPKPIAIQTLLERYGASGDVRAIHEDFRRRMIETYRTDPDVAEISGARETFGALHERGLRVAVDTGFDRETADVVLARMPWAGMLDDSITSDEVARGRPFPDMILRLCERAACTPGEAIKVGDTPSDIQQGRAAGAGLVVGVLYGTHSRAELEAHGPDLLLTDLRDLLPHIQA
jgi:phosphonatase-like hydrolase